MGEETPHPLLIALTGGIGTGKSAVARMLEGYGATIIDADVLAREAVLPGTDTFERVKSAFGLTVVAADGAIDRKALGSIVFSDPARRHALEKILHPKIRELFLRRLSEVRSNPRTNLVVYVVPLFFEAKLPRDDFDLVVVVSAPREVSVERIVSRDGCDRATAERRLAAQLPIEEKERAADRVIQNVGTLEDLTEEVEKFYRELSKPRPHSGKT